MGENDTCSQVPSLEEIVDTIEKNNVDDEIEDDTISLEPVIGKESLIASRTLHNFMVQFKKTTTFGCNKKSQRWGSTRFKF